MLEGRIDVDVELSGKSWSDWVVGVIAEGAVETREVGVESGATERDPVEDRMTREVGRDVGARIAEIRFVNCTESIVRRFPDTQNR